MDTTAFLSQVRSMPWYRQQIAHIEEMPARAAKHGDPGRPLHPELSRRLVEAGVGDLYTHQARAVDAVRAGGNVIVSTPAASGKSLCYHLPVLEALISDRSATSLYMFPTKALAQDQSAYLEELVGDEWRIGPGIYDGDTHIDARGSIRRSARIVITNPDMLHVGILPNHRSWYRILRGLRYVVLDEAHAYRGIFGSHVASVLRRLRRLCARYGSSPSFILCSATIANPADHARRLTGLDVESIELSGAPFGGRDFVLWNPPKIDLAGGKSRRATLQDSVSLMTELVMSKVRTMTFVQSRQLAELLYVRVRNKLRSEAPDLADRVAPYRGSYLAEDRRIIERDLRSGQVMGLTTTSAMELGVNVGDLEATVLAGYPGTRASVWQRAGRSGRGGERALTVLLAQDDPLDQYMARNPRALFGRPTESVLLSTDNPHVLGPHLLCAAYENPLSVSDSEFFGVDIEPQAARLTAEGTLHRVKERWHLRPEVNHPAGSVDIRSSEGEPFALVEMDSGAIMETIDESSAMTQLHPGAVYLHQGSPHLVTELDLEARIARAVRADVGYHTQPASLTETRIISELNRRKAGRVEACFGEVSVTTTVTGFRRISDLSGEEIDVQYVDVPPRSFRSMGLWFGITDDLLATARKGRFHLAGALHAIEHAAIGMLPLFAMCDRGDIGGISTPLHPDTGAAQIILYDGVAGGVGIVERGYDVIEDLWRATLDAIDACGCMDGCPGCIHSPRCGSANSPLDKRGAAAALRAILGAD